MNFFWAVLFCYSCITIVHLTEGQVSTRKELHSRGLEPRITHGRKAKLGQFPWQVAILITTFTDKTVGCGGSLIDEKWILTAAHCLRNAQNAQIFLGTTKHPYIEDSRRTKVWGDTFYMYPEYDNYVLNDIALIELETPVNFSSVIKPIALANKKLPSFSKVIASGWGDTHEGKESKDLLYAHMITLPNDICKISTIHSISGTLCAASEKVKRQSTCKGDSGGPLVYYNKTTRTHFLVGITSHHNSVYGINCKTNLPEFFTDVYQFREWIHNTTKKNSV